MKIKLVTSGNSRRPMRFHLVALLYFFASLVGNCGGSYYIKKPLTGKEVSRVQLGDSLLSVGEVRVSGETRRMVFRKWTFNGSDGKVVRVKYEEYFDEPKDKSDVSELQNIEIVEDSFTMTGKTFRIYELNQVSMAFTVENARVP